MLAQRNFLSYASGITMRRICSGKPAGPRTMRDTWRRATPDLYLAELSHGPHAQESVTCFQGVSLSLGMGGWNDFSDRRRVKEAGAEIAIWTVVQDFGFFL